MTGTLFLIPVALGDSAWARYLPETTRDITVSLRHFIVENAKTARAELKRIGHPGPMQALSIEALPEAAKNEDLRRLLAPAMEGHDLGLMSEAGCPGVADPGALLVRQAHHLGIAVRPLVGPSSLLLALMASGMQGQRFSFHGYLPAREPERSARIRALEKESRQQRATQLFIEAPYRNDALFRALLAACRPDTLLCTASDLTLPKEEVKTSSVGEWRNSPPPELDRRPTVFLLLSAD